MASTLEARIEALERSNRRHRAALVVCVSIAVLTALGAAARPEPEEIRAKRFIATNNLGMETIRIEGAGVLSSPCVRLLQSFNANAQSGAPSIRLATTIEAGGIRVTRNADTCEQAPEGVTIYNGGFDRPVQLSRSGLRVTVPMPDVGPSIDDVLAAKVANTAEWYEKARTWTQSASSIFLGTTDGTNGALIHIYNDKGEHKVTLGLNKKGAGALYLTGDDYKRRQIEASE